MAHVASSSLTPLRLPTGGSGLTGPRVPLKVIFRGRRTRCIDIAKIDRGFQFVKSLNDSHERPSVLQALLIVVIAGPPAKSASSVTSGWTFPPL